MKERCLSRYLFVLPYLLAVFSALMFSGCESKRTIINGLEERDANEILVFLDSKGIPAYKLTVKAEGGGGGGGGPQLYDIAVPANQAAEAMAILNANGLPRRRPQKLLELFGAGGLVPSEMQEKIKYQAGRAEEIASTIRKIDGILDADVQLSFPEEDPLNPKAQKGQVTASVFIKHQGILDDPNSQLIPKIRRLVASSVQGLNYENVTIIADKARFSDVSALEPNTSSSNIELVRIWTIPVLKQATTRFQIIFFSLIALAAVLFLSTLWMLWKIIPVAKECGGLRQLCSIHPLVIKQKNPEEKEKPKEGAEEKKESETEKKAPKVQENVEST